MIILDRQATQLPIVYLSLTDSLPSMPKFADGFHVWMEIKTERSNRTVFVEESMNKSGNIAVLRLLSNVVETKTIFLYDVQQTLVIMGMTIY